MAKNEKTCEWLKCRTDGVMSYLGKRLCHGHWVMISKEDLTRKQENHYRSQLGLPPRNEPEVKTSKDVWSRLSNQKVPPLASARPPGHGDHGRSRMVADWKTEKEFITMSKNGKVSKSTSKGSTKSVSSSKVERKENTGRKSGLSVKEAWKALFVQNEKASKGDRLTDEQILKAMQIDFPWKKSGVFSDVGGVQHERRNYNIGYMNDGKAPSLQSHRYDKNGDAQERRRKSDGAPSKRGQHKNGKRKAA